MAQGGPAIPGASCPRGAAPVGPAAPGQVALREETITPIKIIVKENFTMKKFLSAVLALAMAFALCTTAFADTTVKVTTTPAADEASANISENSWQIPVTAAYNKETSTKDDVTAKYYVVVEWECTNNNLTCTVGKDTYEWTVKGADATSNAKPTSAGYTVTPSTDVQWSGSATYNVTVTNWSNTKVDAKLSWAPATKAGNVTKDIVTTTKFDSDAAAATEKTLPLDAADKDLALPTSTNVSMVTAENAPKANSTLNIEVTDGAISAPDTNIGTLTITVIKGA